MLAGSRPSVIPPLPLPMGENWREGFFSRAMLNPNPAILLEKEEANELRAILR